MSLFLSRALLLVLSLYASVSLARSYTVEVIVFKQTGADTSAGEVWTQKNNGWAFQPKVSQAVITPLPTSTTSIQKLLEAHSDYKILMHKAWKQEIKFKAKTPVVTLSNTPLQSNNSSLVISDTIFGYARFYRGQFLQFELDLRFTPHGFESTQGYGQGSVNFSGAYRQPKEFRIHEKTRVKPKSVYYFDHPRFGVIVAINPIKH